MLVNDEYMIKSEKSYSLADITEFMPSNKRGIKLKAEAADALKRMYGDMVAEGLRPVAISGYRNKEYQSRLFDKEVYTQENTGTADARRSASYFTATPDASEHQIGLAVDISNNSGLSVDFEHTKEGEWLAANCWKYGFVVRYAKNKITVTKKSYEPWHFRYVGVPHAEYMTKYNLVLEEYIAKLHTRGKIEMISEADGKAYKIVCTDDLSEEFENIVSLSDDNAGRYIITMTEETEDNIPEVTAEPVQKEEKPNKENKKSESNTEKVDFTALKNKLILQSRNMQLKAENTVRYINEVLIPKMNEMRVSFERGVEKIVNKIFEPVYIGGKK